MSRAPKRNVLELCHSIVTVLTSGDNFMEIDCAESGSFKSIHCAKIVNCDGIFYCFCESLFIILLLIIAQSTDSCCIHAY